MTVIYFQRTHGAIQIKSYTFLGTFYPPPILTPFLGYFNTVLTGANDHFDPPPLRGVRLYLNGP